MRLMVKAIAQEFTILIIGIFTIAILGYIFYGQSLSWQVILGMFLIVLGLTLVNIYSSKTIN